MAASGKLDKKALPPVKRSEGTEVDLEGLPSTVTEKELVPLWADVLGLKTVDVQESFFDLGGSVWMLNSFLESLLQIPPNIHFLIQAFFVGHQTSWESERKVWC